MLDAKPKSKRAAQRDLDIAYVLLAKHAFAGHGLVAHGSPPSMVTRSVELVREGLARGLRPSPESSELIVDELVAFARAGGDPAKAADIMLERYKTGRMPE